MKYISNCILFAILLLSVSSCLPPRCQVPYCSVLIDHRHPKYGREIAIVPKELAGLSKKKAGKVSRNRNLTGQEIKDNTTAYAESPYQFYRGLPWYLFTFRKKYVDESGMIGGKYRKIDEREVYKYRRYVEVNRERSSKMVAKLKEQQAKEDEKRGLAEDSRNSSKDTLDLVDTKKKKGKKDGHERIEDVQVATDPTKVENKTPVKDPSIEPVKEKKKKGKGNNEDIKKEDQ